MDKLQKRFTTACDLRVVIVPHQSELHPTIKDNWIHQNIMCCAVSAQNYAGIPFVELYFIKVPGRGQHPSVVIAVDIQHKGKKQRTMQGDYPTEPLTQITDAVGNATRNWCWKEHQLAQSSSSGKMLCTLKKTACWDTTLKAFLVSTFSTAPNQCSLVQALQPCATLGIPHQLKKSAAFTFSTETLSSKVTQGFLTAIGGMSKGPPYFVLFEISSCKD
ncbi:hypothetical protein EMCRGX_G021969 [Ephydatia muelleri]